MSAAVVMPALAYEPSLRRETPPDLPTHSVTSFCPTQKVALRCQAELCCGFTVGAGKTRDDLPPEGALHHLRGYR